MVHCQSESKEESLQWSDRAREHRGLFGYVVAHENELLNGCWGCFRGPLTQENQQEQLVLMGSQSEEKRAIESRPWSGEW